jgi:hypothetical protein
MVVEQADPDLLDSPAQRPRDHNVAAFVEGAVRAASVALGRRDEYGRRRRDVTVDEAVGFAQALDVPLIHLLPVHLDPGATGVTLDFATAEELWAFLGAAETVTRGLRQLRAFGWFKEDGDG